MIFCYILLKCIQRCLDKSKTVLVNKPTNPASMFSLCLAIQAFLNKPKNPGSVFCLQRQSKDTFWFCSNPRVSAFLPPYHCELEGFHQNSSPAPDHGNMFLRTTLWCCTSLSSFPYAPPPLFKDTIKIA